jgi:DNA-binding YbaB/EbfC family protein
MKFNIFKLSEELTKWQEELKRLEENIRCEGSAGGGMVKAVADGRGNILSIKIEPELLVPDRIDRELLEDLVVAAVNDALNQVKNTMRKEMQNIIGFPFSDIFPV